VATRYYVPPERQIYSNPEESLKFVDGFILKDTILRHPEDKQGQREFEKELEAKLQSLYYRFEEQVEQRLAPD